MEARQNRGLNGSPSASISPQTDAGTQRGYGARSYNYTRRGVRGNFVPPIRSNGNNTGNTTSRNAGKNEDTLDDSTKRWYGIYQLTFEISNFGRIDLCSLTKLHVSIIVREHNIIPPSPLLIDGKRGISTSCYSSCKVYSAIVYLNVVWSCFVALMVSFLKS